MACEQVDGDETAAQNLVGKQRMKYNAGSLPGMRDDHKVGTILPKMSQRISVKA
jgi:hypothetical protein